MNLITINKDNEWHHEHLGEFALNPINETPFKVYIYPKFLTESSHRLLRSIVILEVQFEHKDNDLYKFYQSDDLQASGKEAGAKLYIHFFTEKMKGEMREYLERRTCKKLSSVDFDITASRYDNGNYLLCHNDDIKHSPEKGGRALAFVYYLTTLNWKPHWGGHLTLYDSDSDGEPVTVNNRIAPRPNMLVVFETGPTSWHAVEEVKNDIEKRLSINGWFHLDASVPFTPYIEQSIEHCPYYLYKPVPMNNTVAAGVLKYINKIYCMESVCYNIRKKFKEQGAVELRDFFIPERYYDLNTELRDLLRRNEACDYIDVGPYNKRHYRLIEPARKPKSFRDVFEVFRSDFFLIILSCLTGLNLDTTDFIGRNTHYFRKKSKDDYPVDSSSSGEDSSDGDRPTPVAGDYDVVVDKLPTELCKEQEEEILKLDLFRAKCVRTVWKEQKRASDKLKMKQQRRKSCEEFSQGDKSQGTSCEPSTSKQWDSSNEQSKKVKWDTSGDWFVWSSSSEDSDAEIKYTKPIISIVKGVIDRPQPIKKRRHSDPSASSSKRMRVGQEASTSKPLDLSRKKVLDEKKLKRLEKKSQKKKAACNPLIRQELRLIEKGSYTLLHDFSFEMHEKSCLDVMLFFNHELEGTREEGGFIEYLDTTPDSGSDDSDSALLTVIPKPNTLYLAYRDDKGTGRYMKYVNNQHKSDAQMLSCVYYESPEAVPNRHTIVPIGARPRSPLITDLEELKKRI